MRPRDRLPELYHRAGISRGSPGTPDAPPAPPASIADILEEAERVRGWVREVRRDTQLARALLGQTGFHSRHELQEQLDAVITNSNAVGLKVCGALRQLEARAAGAAGSLEARAAGAAGSLEARVARLQLHAARRGYSDALHEQHALLGAARDTQLQLLREQARILNLTISDDECQSLLDADSNIALFVDNVRAETAEARLALRAAEARHAELARVEAALREVRALFAQLAALVAQQQEQLDSVLHVAGLAGARVEDGQRQLLKGSVTRKRTRKKKLSLIVCLAAGFLVVLLVLIFT